LPTNQNALALCTLAVLLQRVDPDGVDLGLLRWKVAYRATPTGVNANRRFMGVRVDFVPKTTPKSDALASLHAPSAYLP